LRVEVSIAELYRKQGITSHLSMSIFKLLWKEVLATACVLQTNRTTYDTVFITYAAQSLKFD